MASFGGPPLPDHVASLVPPGGLWTHQARALELIRSGRSAVLATPTASGKSLVYQLAIAEAASTPVRAATSLLLFPTKALAQDQLRSFQSLEIDAVVAAAYDGDSTSAERQFARTHANCLLTNPEMLHHGLLPNHRRWATFLGRLRYVVIDETHVLDGVFGSNVAHLLRRLARLAHRYGAEPTFLCTSATIGEPQRLSSDLCGVPMTAIVDDGSPRGPRYLVAWDPTAAPQRSRGLRHETASVAASLLGAGLRTLVFCRSRNSTEVVADRLRTQMGDPGRDRIRAYRGGYLVDERREIEAEIDAGWLDGVVATSALELGMDIRGLDAVVMSGFPGTIASMWQQVGRAGRHGAASVGVLVGGSGQLDRWAMDHAHEAFRRPPERAVINPGNPHVIDAQLACAAHELPLAPEDDRYWGTALDDVVLRGVRDDWLSVRRRGPRHVRAVWSGPGWPSARVGLRSASRGEYRIVESGGGPIGTIDAAVLQLLAHLGAVYLHQGQSWRVVGHDHATRIVVVEADPGTTSTHARSHTEVSVLQTDSTRQVGLGRVHLGWVEVSRQVTGYRIADIVTRRTVGNRQLDLPATTWATRAVRYEFGAGLLDVAGVNHDRLGPALHAIEHVVIGILPLFAICGRGDVGGTFSVRPAEGENATASVTVYDMAPGGSGIAELTWEAADRHLAAALGLIERCDCTDGCPSCIQSPACSEWNDRLDKSRATRLLRAWLTPRLAPPVAH